MKIQIKSFGFKYKAPNADLIFSARTLVNPHNRKDMRNLKGTDKKVSDFVLKTKKAKDLIKVILDSIDENQKDRLKIAIGCTGGKHRSVAIAEYLYDILDRDYDVKIYHRDINRK